jgi:hypothetical protein
MHNAEKAKYFQEASDPALPRLFLSSGGFLPSLPAGGSDAGPFHLPHNQASGSTLRMGQLIRASLHSCLAHYVYESLAPTPAHGLLIACRQVPSEKRKRQSPFIMRSRGGCSVCSQRGLPAGQIEQKWGNLLSRRVGEQQVVPVPSQTEIHGIKSRRLPKPSTAETALRARTWPCGGPPKACRRVDSPGPP